MQVAAAARTPSKRRASTLSSLETSSLLDDEDWEGNDASAETNSSRDTIISFDDAPTAALRADEEPSSSAPRVFSKRDRSAAAAFSNGDQRKSRDHPRAKMKSSLPPAGRRANRINSYSLSNSNKSVRIAESSARKVECGKYHYLASGGDSLRVPSKRARVGFSNHRRYHQDPPRLMRLSASSPSGFEVENNKRGSSFSFLTAKTPEDGDGSDDEDDCERWRLLGDSSDDWTPRPSSCNQARQRRSVESAGVEGHLGVPVSKVSRAESESLLSRGRDRMAAALTPTESVGSLLERHGSASVCSSRWSFRYSVRSVNADVIPRRHSRASSPRNGTAGEGAGSCAKEPTQAPLQPSLSQPCQPRAAACSLVMVSPNAVSRSPSQQWLRNSPGAMPTSFNPTVNTVPQPPSQTQPDPNSLTVFDHRNVFTPIPGAVGSGGLQNPLYNVSNEFMRVAGYSQQFKRLLSKRDGSIKRPGVDWPGVTFAGESGKEKDLEKGALPSPVRSGFGHESGERAVLAAAGSVPGGAAASPAAGGDCAKDSASDIPILDPKRPTRKSAYGRLWKEQPNLKHRLKKRKMLFLHRTKVSDFALLFALIGIVLTILEAELTASGVVAKTDYASLLLRALVVATTAILLGLLVLYHAIETKIAVIDSGAEDWRVAITYDRLWQCALEVAVCSVCPFPANVDVAWDRLKADHRTPYSVAVPLDAVLSVPMFLRTYLFGRFMALHSRQFQDAATRSIAALNHIAVNFTFVLKTLMHEHPLRVLILFTVAFWVAMSWILTQCERYVSVKVDPDQSENNHYLNSIWFIIITFMSIGYGDIVPNTYCGRALAITTGIVGAGVSSALIAVISRKLELSRAEKHVNQFMTDSKLTRQRKEAAAAVLQHTWFIHKYKNIPKAKDDMKLRMHQRRFLAAINEFRRVKWDQRKLAEQGNALVDVAKLQSDMHETLWDMQQNQDRLVTQMGALMLKMQELQDVILAQSQDQNQNQNRNQEKSGAFGAVTRQFSLHPASPTEPSTPRLVVEGFGDGTTGGSFDEIGRTVML